MSYLLTEIALEMLGYKFHDIDGVLKQINFRKGGANDEGNPEEQLGTILGINDSLGINNDETVQPQPNPASSMEKGQSSGNLKHSGSGADATPNPAKKIKVIQYRDVPLSKLLNLEFERINAQILRNKTEHILERQQTVINKNENVTNEFVKQQRELLRKQLITLKPFRSEVERRVQHLDDDLYKKYIDNFNFKQYAAKRTDNRKFK